MATVPEIDRTKGEGMMEGGHMIDGIMTGMTGEVLMIEGETIEDGMTGKNHIVILSFVL